MKKLLAAACFVTLAMTACLNGKSSQERSQADSLQQVLNERDSQLNDMMATMNEIQEGFRQIGEAENQLNIAKDGEGGNKSQQIKDNIRFIAEKMKSNKENIERLEQKLKSSGIKNSQLEKMLADLKKQLEEKNQQFAQLQAELDAKDVRIMQLDETVNNLNTNVENLKQDNSQKEATIQNQDAQLNTAWYVFGTKSELKEQSILVNGKVLQSNFNKSYFTKIDIRNTRQVKLQSKYAKMLTVHPSGSYTLTQDANKEYVLDITNPELFWSTSKYLVILVK